MTVDIVNTITVSLATQHIAAEGSLNAYSFKKKPVNHHNKHSNKIPKQNEKKTNC